MGMQVKDLLSRLKSRDTGRELEQPVLEDLCVYGCMLSDEAVNHINMHCSPIMCHSKRPASLESSTWIGKC